MSEKNDIALSIVVPIYNNQSTLKELVQRISETCQKCCEKSYEVILVDDGSKDMSWEIIRELSSKFVRGIKFSRNFGQHSALKAGFAASSGQNVIMLDADLEDDPEIIEKIFAKLVEGFDICYTNLIAGNEGSLRKTSKFFQKYTNNSNPEFAGKQIGTMRGFNRRVLGSILRYGERRPVYGPLITALGFSHAFVDVNIDGAKGSHSSYTFRKRIKLALDYLIGYTSVITGFFMAASFVAFLASISYAALIVIQYIFFDIALPPGLSFLAIAMLLLFSVLYFGIGIMGIYMQRLLDENLQRPIYIVAETTDSSFEEEFLKEEMFHVRRD